MKELIARDVMSQEFSTIHQSAPVNEVVSKLTELDVRSTGYKSFSLIVVDELGKPTGMVSIFDVLFHLRPPFLNYELNSFPLWKDEMEPYIQGFKQLTAEQIMHAPVMTCSPDDLVMQIADRLVKQRIRRLPVVENDTIIGVIYLSDMFAILCKTWVLLETE